MRAAYWSLLLVLVVPSAAAGPLGAVTSDSPVELYGTAASQGSDVQLFHLAFEDGSLRGTVYTGRVVERHHHVNPCFGPMDGGGPGTDHHHVLYNASAGSVPNPISFEVAKDSLTIVDLGEEAVPSGTGVATDAGTDGAEPAARFAPNPYDATSSDQEVEADTGAYGQAFPATEFLTIPNGEVAFPLQGVIRIEFGEVTVTQGGRSQTLSADSTSEEAQCSFPFSQTMPSAVYHSVWLEVDTGSLTVEQGDLGLTLDFYRGDYTPEPGMGSASPRGQWPRDAADELPQAWEQYALPATSLAATDLRGIVEGVAVFSDAQGQVAEDDGLRDVDEDTLALSGNLELVPAAVEDEGRRMRVDLDGSLFTVNTDLAKADQSQWTSYAAGALGGAIVFGLALYAWPSLKWGFLKWAVVPLYARLRKEEILENPLRDDILQAVQDEPGISASELGRRLECGWGTLVYHLTVLERMRLVSSAREGRHKRFFAQGRINYSDKGAVALLANPAARNILDAIRASPGAIQKDLSERLHLSPGTVAWHVERLAAEGLVVKEEMGRTVRYFPSDRLLELTRQLAA